MTERYTIGVGTRIKNLIDKNCFNVEQLALEIDISPNHLRKLLRDEYNWKESYIRWFVEKFDADYEYIRYGKLMVDNKLDFNENLNSCLQYIKLMPEEYQDGFLLSVCRAAIEILEKRVNR